eukprot:CAMPEP_0178406794 /NCGR_PEP_ID=MMETSP0689_2-20121128/19094_1 /TAXON_ID=160604 /ORGANISM="Amphidinium massartii, Strain CS-259" /LENGTH=305 /DNA_ID=CAMNT_0020027843 /DNA_START=110 /DNA_END=1027 /DNA_ORIENTATION=-
MSGGVLLSVAFCHMLSESAHSLDDWGIRARASMGACSLDEDGELDAQCEPFPAGLALALLGLLVTVAISGGRPHDHKSQDDAFAPLPLTGSPTQAGLSPVVLGAADDAAEDEAEDDGERGSMVVSKAAPSAAQSKPAQTEPGIDAILLEVLQPVLGPLVSECGVSSTAGFGTLVAMSVHSTIEGLAVGASSTAWFLRAVAQVLCQLCCWQRPSSPGGEVSQALHHGVCSLGPCLCASGHALRVIASRANRWGLVVLRCWDSDSNSTNRHAATKSTKTSRAQSYDGLGIRGGGWLHDAAGSVGMRI